MVLRVVKREISRIVREPRYLIITTLGIVFSFVFFATMTKEGQPNKLPIAVVDMDGTYLSRRICHELEATHGVTVYRVYNNHTEARKAMQRGDIYAFYEIPHGTYNDLLQFRAPHFVLYVNSAYMLAGTLSYKQLAAMGMMAAAAVQPQLRRLFNHRRALGGLGRPDRARRFGQGIRRQHHQHQHPQDNLFHRFAP